MHRSVEKKLHILRPVNCVRSPPICIVLQLLAAAAQYFLRKTSQENYCFYCSVRQRFSFNITIFGFLVCLVVLRCLFKTKNKWLAKLLWMSLAIIRVEEFPRSDTTSKTTNEENDIKNKRQKNKKAKPTNA